jgi:hypothetical protein
MRFFPEPKISHIPLLIVLIVAVGSIEIDSTTRELRILRAIRNEYEHLTPNLFGINIDQSYVDFQYSKEQINTTITAMVFTPRGGRKLISSCVKTNEFLFLRCGRVQ